VLPLEALVLVRNTTGVDRVAQEVIEAPASERAPARGLSIRVGVELGPQSPLIRFSLQLANGSELEIKGEQ
jgi:hypothetical protein